MSITSVLMFCPKFRPVIGGAERQAEKLSVALAEKGCRVTVVTPKIDAESPEYEEVAGFVIHRFPIVDLCKSLPLIPGLGMFNLIAIWIQTRYAVRDLVKSHDLVHAHGVSAITVFALSVANKMQKPFICKATSSGHGSDLLKLTEIGMGGANLATYMQAKSTAWIATSAAVAKSLTEHGVDSKRIFHIPNGVLIPQSYGKERTTGVQRFIYIGRLSRACERDFETLIRSFLILAEKHEHIELALVGDGDLLETISVQVEQSGFKARVHLPGFAVDPSEWYEWADCFVLPSIREGMSNSLIEAMAYGLVCIANDIPANREVLDNGKAGVLVRVGDVDELTSRMEGLVSCCSQAIPLSRAARNRAELNYSINSVVSKTIVAYEQILSK